MIPVHDPTEAPQVAPAVYDSLPGDERPTPLAVVLRARAACDRLAAELRGMMTAPPALPAA